MAFVKYLRKLLVLLAIFAVAPHTGAWIEIDSLAAMEKLLEVAPHTGAWIEIDLGEDVDNCPKSRPPHGGVD